MAINMSTYYMAINIKHFFKCFAYINPLFLNSSIGKYIIIPLVKMKKLR